MGFFFVGIRTTNDSSSLIDAETFMQMYIYFSFTKVYANATRVRNAEHFSSFWAVQYLSAGRHRASKTVNMLITMCNPRSGSVP